MSGNELMLALSNEVERNDRYAAPPAHTGAGRLDRQNEKAHVMAVRQYEREAREAVAAAARETVADIAWLDGRERLLTEAKFNIDRAKKMSAAIAQGDPELGMQFAILDDEYLAVARLCCSKARPELDSRLFS